MLDVCWFGRCLLDSSLGFLEYLLVLMVVCWFSGCLLLLLDVCLLVVLGIYSFNFCWFCSLLVIFAFVGCFSGCLHVFINTAIGF